MEEMGGNGIEMGNGSYASLTQNSTENFSNVPSRFLMSERPTLKTLHKL